MELLKAWAVIVSGESLREQCLLFGFNFILDYLYFYEILLNFIFLLCFLDLNIRTRGKGGFLIDTDVQFDFCSLF